MDYKKFLKTIVKELKGFYGRKADIEVKNMIQNNDVHRDGLLITFPGKGESVCPVIYLDTVFESFSDGSKTMDECIGMIANMREEFAADNGMKNMANELLNWENVKGSVYPALISVSENREVLKKFAYTPFLDLATIYIIRRELGDEGNASVKITNTMLNFYGIEKGKLHQQATANLEKDNYEMADMMELLLQALPESEREMMPDTSGLEAGKMYVLTNASKFYGAAGILDSKLLERSLGNMTAFILPSSIHETIFVPISEGMDADSLNRTIREVNDTQLDVSERLSDHCYIYDGKSKRIKMCA